MRTIPLALSFWTGLASLTSLPATAASFRSIDGSGNNLHHSHWGQANTPLLRLAEPAYDDGYNTPRATGIDGTPLPNPRDISNEIVRQDGRSIFNSLHLSDWIWQWGQFIDHDLDLNEPAQDAAPTNIPVTDPSDPLYPEIPFQRNAAAEGTGVPGNPRQQVNTITAYLDASQVYGSSQEVAEALRGSGGKLLSQFINGEELLPFQSQVGVPVANPLMLPPDRLFAAGDSRGNEQVGLMAAHTLFLREHNRLAAEIGVRLDGSETELVEQLAKSGLSREDFIYESARKLVGAQIQVITYHEFLPLLVGEGALAPYSGYKDDVDAGISSEFANAAFRLGHTLLSPQLLRVDDNRQQLGSLSLAAAFFNTQEVTENGIDSLLMGLASQKSQEFDNMLVDEVRNLLFPAGSGGNDLAAVNIMRGRDVGLPSLNAVREVLGLPKYESFDALNPDLADRFASLYGSIDDVDLWIGGISEQPDRADVLLGETFRAIVTDRFTRLRDGDRFFYLNNEEGELDFLRLLDPTIESTRLSEIVRRNSTIKNIQDNAFIYIGVPEPPAAFSLLMLGILGPLWRFSNRRT